MVNGLTTAQKAAKKAIEATYFGKATVTEHQKIKNEASKLTEYVERIVLENQPCHVSYERLQTTVQSESAAAITQVIKLFLSPDIIIKPNSKITVTQNQVTRDYTYSGVPAVFPTHQEITLELFQKWN